MLWFIVSWWLLLDVVAVVVVCRDQRQAETENANYARRLGQHNSRFGAILGHFELKEWLYIHAGEPAGFGECDPALNRWTWVHEESELIHATCICNGMVQSFTVFHF